MFFFVYFFVFLLRFSINDIGKVFSHFVKKAFCATMLLFVYYSSKWTSFLDIQNLNAWVQNINKLTQSKSKTQITKSVLDKFICTTVSYDRIQLDIVPFPYNKHLNSICISRYPVWLPSTSNSLGKFQLERDVYFTQAFFAFDTFPRWNKLFKPSKLSLTTILPKNLSHQKLTRITLWCWNNFKITLIGIA